MRTRHALGAAIAGLVLSAATAAVPAPATAAVVAAAPSSVNALVSAKGPSHQPHEAHRPHKAHKAHKAHHGRRKHSVKPAAPLATATSTRTPQAIKPHTSTPHATRALRIAPGVTPQPPRSPPVNPSPPVLPIHTGNVVQRVTTALQTVANLFGWNLLTLIPMTGIAFAISRRISPTRRSASKLPPPPDLRPK